MDGTTTGCGTPQANGLARCRQPEEGNDDHNTEQHELGDPPGLLCGFIDVSFHAEPPWQSVWMIVTHAYMLTKYQVLYYVKITHFPGTKKPDGLNHRAFLWLENGL